MLQPLFNRVIIKLIEPPKETKGGIILLDDIRPKSQTSRIGVVQSIGGGGVTKTGKTLKMMVKPGDKVVVEPKHASSVEICGIEYLILPEEHIQAVVED